MEQQRNKHDTTQIYHNTYMEQQRNKLIAQHIHGTTKKQA